MKKIAFFLAVSLMLFVFLPPLGEARTDIDSDVTSNTIWDLSGSPYVISGNIYVESGVTLTINPNVVVKFEQYSSIYIYGTLVADGEPGQQIYFTSIKDDDDAAGGDTNGDGDDSSPAPGDWYYLYFHGANPENLLNNVVVRYGGSGSGSVYINTSSPMTVSNSVIEQGLYYGIYAYNTGEVTLTNNTISDNGQYGIYGVNSTLNATDNTISGHTTGAIHLDINSLLNPDSDISNNSLSGNALDTIVIGGTLSEDATLPASYGTYVVDYLTVTDGATLTIEPGTVVKFTQYGYMYIYGTLVADGEPGQQIYFTSIKDDDDAAGGDTNGDGDDSSPAPGDWYYLYFYGANPGNLLDNVVVRYGGSGSGSLFIYTSSSMNVSNSVIEDSLYYGIYLYNAADITLTGNSILGNGSIGIYLHNSAGVNIFRNIVRNNGNWGIYCANGSDPVIGGSEANANAIYGHASYGVINTDPSIPVNATHNYWGHSSGPSGFGPGTGDAVSDYVDFDPWIGTSPFDLAPAVSDIPDQTTDEGGTFVDIYLDDYVSDADNADDEIIWTYSGNTDLTVNIVNRVAAIDIPGNWTGAETITFTATDPGGLSDSESATFTVNDTGLGESSACNEDAECSSGNCVNAVTAPWYPANIGACCPLGEFWAVDHCEPCVESDGDEVCDSLDNCPAVFNADQADADSNGVGDICDAVSDTDGDGLSDADEVNLHGTDPANPDSDGDWVGDGVEISKNTNPNNPDEFTPPGTGAIKGTVNDSGGFPITTNDIRVQIITGEPCGGWQQIDEVITSDGNYIVVGLDPGQDYWVRTDNMWQSNYVNAWYASPSSSIECNGAQLVNVPENGSADGTDFQLDMGVEISGTVYRADGSTAIEDAPINVTAFRAGDPCQGHTYTWSLGTQTDITDGSFTLKGVPVGTDSVYLSTNNMNQSNWVNEYWRNIEFGSTSDCFAAELLEVPADGASDLSFQLDLGGSVSGYVTDASDDPIPNLWVHVNDSLCGSGQWFGGDETDVNGYYQIMGIRESGDVFIQTCADCSGMDWVDEWWDGDINSGSIDCNGAVPTSITPGVDSGGISFQLEPGGSISGQITDENASPIEGIWVEAFTGRCWDNFVGGVETNSNGEFTIERLPPGEVYVHAWPQRQNYVEAWYDGNSGNYDCSLAAPITVVASQTTSEITIELDDGPRRIDWWELAVWDGVLSVGFDLHKNFERFLEGATISGPNGFHEKINIEKDMWDWLTDCQYYAAWDHNIGRNFEYGEYTLMLTFMDGVQASYSREIAAADPLPVDPNTISHTIWPDGRIDINWTPPDLDAYYHARIYGPDGNRYVKTGDVKGDESANFSAQDLRCLEIGQTYRYQIRAHDKAWPQNAVTKSPLIEFVYTPTELDERIEYFEFGDWQSSFANGNFAVGFDVRPGSREHVTQAQINGPSGGLFYQFDLAADWVDISTERAFAKAWWRVLTATVATGDYTLQVQFDDGYSETRTFTRSLVDVYRVDSASMQAEYFEDGSIRFYWGIPAGASSQRYQLVIRSTDGNQHFYYGPNEINQTEVWTGIWDLRYLEHGQPFHWFVRARDPQGNRMEESERIEFTYNPFNIAPTGSISGNVSAPGGPIEGLTVRAYYNRCGESFINEAKTDANGDYTIPAVFAGDVYVEACATCDNLNFVNKFYDGAAGTSHCGEAAAVSVSDNQETPSINIVLDQGPQRLEFYRLLNLNGELQAQLAVLPGFRDLLTSATLDIPNPNRGNYTYDLAIDRRILSSECRYEDRWEHNFGGFDETYDYGNYTLTLTFADGSTETYTRTIDEADVPAVSDISVTIHDDGSADLSWNKNISDTHTDDYSYVVHIMDGAGNHYGVFDAGISANRARIPASRLKCLEIGQTYRWQVAVYDKIHPVFTVGRTAEVNSAYAPTSLDRTEWARVRVWLGVPAVGFGVRPGSRLESGSHVLSASVTGSGISYTFDIAADRFDESTETYPSGKGWWHADPSWLPAEGDYTFTIGYDEDQDGTVDHTETITDHFENVPAVAVSDASLIAATLADGAMTFSWALPSGVIGQKYAVKIRSANELDQFYQTPTNNDAYNITSATATARDLRGLKHGQAYQWAVRAYEQWDLTSMQENEWQTFVYDPFNLAQNDSDNDGIFDIYDNCLNDPNDDQKDNDKDGFGDVCDDDDDNDGLTDIEEQTYTTDPLDPDSDSDGLQDGEEVNTYNTNPLDSDSDDDTVNDGDEAANGTNPNNSDTDGDGIADNLDNCPTVANSAQSDTDGDSLGDLCDPFDNSIQADGLIGEYYNGWSRDADGVITFAGSPIFERVDQNIDFWNGSAYYPWQPAGLSPDNFSVKWTGYIRVDEAGEYGFGLISDDGSQVWIDGSLIVDNSEIQWFDWEDNIAEGSTVGLYPSGGGSDEPFGPLYLKAGFHSIEVRFYENGAWDGIELWWLKPNAGPSDIPYYNSASSVYYNSATNWEIVPPGVLYSTLPLADSDNDGIPNDGDNSGVVSDNPCTNGETANCDDNCPNISNPDQTDFDNDGIGDVCDCESGLPDPVLEFTGETYDYTDAFGDEYTAYVLEVTNRSVYPDEFFAPAPHLPPCGSNTNSARTWVDIFDNDDNPLYGNCGLTDSAGLGSLSFNLPKGTPPPQSVYIVLIDRECNVSYISNLATITIVDFDGDGIPDSTDPDDDNDNVADGDDTDPLNANICRDVDADGCDDCSSGVDDPANDGADSDGDGLCDPGDTDADGDGFDSEAAGGPDCNDLDAEVHPGAAELPGDGIDQDCDGSDAIDISPAVTYHVDPVNGTDDASHGGDSGSGAWKSLHYAIQLITSGPPGAYTLNLATGTYTFASEGSDTPLVLNQDIIINGGAATLDGSGTHDGSVENPWTTGLIISEGAENVQINNLTIRNFKYGMRVSSSGGCLTTTYVTIDSCETGMKFAGSSQLDVNLNDSTWISGCTTAGVEFVAASANIILRNGTIRNNAADGIRVEDAEEAPESIRIENMLVENNAGYGILLADGSNHTIYDCEVRDNNLNEDAHAGIGVFTGDTVVTRNTIQGNHYLGVFADDALSVEPLDATYNYWGSPSGPSGEGPGTGDGVSENALFVPWFGSAPDIDTDSDGVADADDNCPANGNADQADSDGDDIGDACDPDADGDGFNSITFGGLDCGDNDASIYPGAQEIPNDDVDQDCDGSDLISDLTAGTYFVDVDNGSDDPALGRDSGNQAWGSLKFALRMINHGASGDYVLNLAPGIYNLASEVLDIPLVVEQNLTINGTGAVLDGSGDQQSAKYPWKSGIIIAPITAKITLEGLTIQNFEQGILVGSEGGCLDLIDVAINGCGTGIKLAESYQIKVDLHDSTVTGCTNGIEITAGSSNNTIIGGEVSGSIYDGILVDASNESPADNLIDGVQILSNARHGIALRGGSGTQVINSLVRGNNKGSDREGYGAIAVLSCGASLRWNTIEDNDCAGIYADEATALDIHGNLIRDNGDGIRLAYTNGVTVQNNTITENVDGLVIEDGSAPDIIGNIIWNNGLATDLVVMGAFGRIEDNDVGTTNLLSMPADNISQDPKFKNPSAGDYSLEESSPCIDAMDLVDEGIDCDHGYRPLGQTWDMGAFESPGYADEDDDDLPDWWEQRIADADGGDAITDHNHVNGDDDFDGDGVSNWNEWLNGTDPTTQISVTITVPADNPAYTDSTTINIEGLAESAASVELSINGSDPIAAQLIGDSWTAAGLNLQPGQNLIVVTAHGADTPATDNLTVIRDAQAPTVAIVDPVVESEFPTSADSISINGLATDDSGLSAVTWLRQVEGQPDLDGDAQGLESWDTGNIPLVKDSEENTINTITVGATDRFGNTGSVTIQVRHEPAAAIEENVLLEEEDTGPDVDEQDRDGDKYLNEDESSCLGQDSTAPNDSAVTPPNYADTDYPSDPAHKDYDETKVGYKWPDCINPDDDNDGLEDECELVFGSTTSAQGPADDYDLDGVTNLQECVDGTDLKQAPASDFQLTITDLSGTKGYNDWLPGFGRVLKIEAQMVGDQAPATVLFSLQNTSSYPGRAVNDPAKTLVAIDRYPGWYDYNGFDFGLTATNPITDATVHSLEQGPISAPGNVISTDPTVVVYEAYLQCWDYGARTMLLVKHPSNSEIRSEIWVPKGSGANGISSAWQYDSDPTYRLDGNADIDKIVFDETMEKYPAPQGDDFNNFEEYRGILYYPAAEMNKTPEARVLTHQRLNPHRKDLFVRAQGFDDAAGDPYRPFDPPVEDGIPQWLQYDPFRLGLAFKNTGIDVHNTTGWGHDVTEDYKFFLYYRQGTIEEIKGTIVKGIDTQWLPTWPLYEWEFKLDIDPGDQAPTQEENRWLPVVLWEDPFTKAADTLALAFKYKDTEPADLGTGQYAIRMPLPHINVLIVRHDHKLQGVYSSDTGFIRFISATPPDNLDPTGSRHWSWATKGLGISNPRDGNNGIAMTLKKPLDHIFGDKPYLKGTVWDADARIWRNAQGDEVTALAPLARCEDQADQMTPIDGILPGDTENGQWDGDRRLGTYTEWTADGQLSPFDVDGDGFIELPFVSDPSEADPGVLNPDFEYTKAHVLMHTTTHEVAHAIGAPSHTDVDICLMYRYSNNYNRANYLSNWFRSLLRVNNRVR